MSDPDPTLVERVRKLLDKSSRTDNQHEADIFARKAAELVARHRIDPARLAEGARSGDLSLVEVPVGRGAYVRARLHLLGSIAEAHDVRMVFRSTPTGSIAMLAGFQEDLDVVEVMYASLHQQAASQMSEIKKGTGAATQRHRRAFLFGFADRVGELLSETRTSVEQEPAPDTAASNALVMQERSERIDEFAMQTWGRVRSASAPSAVSAEGHARGVSAANRADVGRARLRGRKSIGSGR